MAELTRSRARKPLAEGPLNIGHSRAANNTSWFSVGVACPISDRATFYNFQMDESETKRFVIFVAKIMTRPIGEPDLTPADALRKLADSL